MALIRVPVAAERRERVEKANGGTHSSTSRDREKREMTITIFAKVILCAEGHAMLRILKAGAQAHWP